MQGINCTFFFFFATSIIFMTGNLKGDWIVGQGCLTSDVQVRQDVIFLAG